MVRVGAKRRLDFTNDTTPKSNQSSPPFLGKKRKNVGNASTNNSNIINNGRSKRSRTFAIPYQTPESINKVMKAISTANANSTTTPKTNKVNKITSASSASNKKKALPSKRVPVKSKPIKKPVAKLSPTKKTTKKKSSVKTVVKRNVAKKLIKAAVVGSQQKRTGKQSNTKLVLTSDKEKKKAESSGKTTKNNKKAKNEAISIGVGGGKVKRKSKKETLNPKPNVTLYEKDPTFYSNQEIPYISTLAHSRLIFRAVLMNDSKLLKKLITTETSQLCSLCIPRSTMGDDSTPLETAVKVRNKDAIKMLLELEPSIEKKFGPSPDLLIQAESTGHGSRMMFGHGLRAVTVGRGGKEGHAALLKDENDYNISNENKIPQKYNFQYIVRGIEEGMEYSFLSYLLTLHKDQESSLMNELTNHIDGFVRHGNVEIAGKLAESALKRGGYGFNFLHVEALTNTSQDFSAFKPVSVTKKSMSGSRLTPLHCAAINPNPKYLQTLLNSQPEYTLVDRQNWMPIHYAAVCVGDGPLKLLLSRGVSTLVTEKDGNTPLSLAVSRGRLHNVKAILAHEQQNQGKSNNEDENDDDTTSTNKKAIEVTSSLEKVNKIGMRPLHMASKIGNVEIVKLLLKVGADPEKFTPAQFEKLTPLMIACLYGHLDVVKLLIGHGVKVAVVDRRGRTAIFHAVINGHAHILSYLLRLGVNHEVTDSSGNTLAHYASAYGWYFALKLLLEAGCDVVKGNDWKLTAIAIAFMKGHVGIVEMLVKEPGVEVNTPVDGDSGMTLLLKACSSTTMKSSLVPRLKFLVEELGADCTTVDFKGNNALHHLAGHYLNKDWKEFSTMFKNLSDAVKFLVSHGCDLNALNGNNETCLMIACSTKTQNYWIAEKFTDYGVKLDSSIVDNSDEETILHRLAQGANSQYVENLVEKLAKDPDNLKALKEMAKIKNKQGMTPLYQLFSKIKSAGVDQIPYICNFVTFFVKKLNADVNSLMINNNQMESSSILHQVVLTNYATKIIPILQTTTEEFLNLDPLDTNLQTPLANLILSQGSKDIEVAKFLINSGANVNVQCQSHDSLNLLLLLAIHQPSMYSLIPEMIAKGVDFRQIDHKKTQNSALHFVCQNPKESSSFVAIKALVRAGIKVNLKNKDGRTALHLLVNARGNETDVAYDIEDFLLTSGADLRIKDIRGRTPLHFCFVKIGKPFEKTHLDPIELVMILLNAVKGTDKTQFVKIPDIFGGTALHYASMRGATICCSFFTSEIKDKKDVDIKDMRGNTPFGLAVWCGHEGSSLHFQQLGANFLEILDTNIELVKMTKFGDDDENDSKSDKSSNNNSSSEEENENDDEENASSSKALLRSDFSFKNIKLDDLESKGKQWIWAHKVAQDTELCKMKMESMKYPIFQEVVKKEWQGILHLMIAKLQSSSSSNISIPVSTAIKTQKLRLALKLIHRVKDSKELQQVEETLLHTLAKNSKPDGGGGVELQVQVLKRLVEKGVDPKQNDSFGCNAINYAIMNQNYMLVTAFEEVLSLEYISRMNQDNLGRTAFSSLFWKLNEFLNISDDLTKWASTLLKSVGGNNNSANVLTKYPFLLSPYPGVRCLVKHHHPQDVHPTFPSFSPLIAAVLHQRYNVVSWLLRQKSSSTAVVKLNFGDDQGRTALMHAVRLNDLKMVKLLFNPHSYNAELDYNPWNFNYSNWVRGKSSSELNIDVQDRRGWTALDYLVCPSLIDGESQSQQQQQNLNYSYANVEQILLIFHKAGASFIKASGDGKSPLERAIETKQFHIVKFIHKILKTPIGNQQKDFTYGTSSSSSIPVIQPDPNLGPSIKDFSEDAKKIAMMKVAAENEQTVFKVLPDPLLGLEPDNSEVVIDPDQNNIPFDCVLTQVDLGYGLSGLYNFYKMQVVKQPRGKQLVVLFTQWGRVGDEGQYQKTPFPTEEDAVKEFKKIFKAKTSNNWDDGLDKFQPAPKRYRLVHKDINAKRPEHITVDFEKLENGEQLNASKMNSTEVYKLIRSLTLTHNISTRNQYRYRSPQSQKPLEVSKGLPIISTEALQKADAVLSRIKVILAEKHRMHYSNHTENYSEVERLQIFNQLIEASEEFYALVPVYGFASEALMPIFDLSALQERQEEIYRLIHMGFAKEIILAAEFHTNNINPFDYIYRSLDTKLAVLDMDKNSAENYEGQLILQYIHNTSPKTQVQGIYRIQGAEEHDEISMDNRWLLWHGTKAENVLSVLHTGLKIAPLGVDRMGELFGKGIYFADAFTKSEGYTSGDIRSSSKYIFLCEVALGKIKNIRLNSDEYSTPKIGTEKPIQKGFDSLKTSDSRYIPDPATTVYWNGKAIPLGPSVEQIFPKDQYPGLQYNEYIIFNQKQVKLRYLIQFK